MTSRVVCDSKLGLTIGAHSHLETFLEPTVLAAVSVVFGDFAVSVSSAGVAQLFADASFEKSFATFATYGSVVPSGSPVTAHHARFTRRRSSVDSSSSVERPQTYESLGALIFGSFKSQADLFGIEVCHG